MKHALISPNEPVENGYRVAEVADAPFDVASPLFWVECADEVVSDAFYFSLTDRVIKAVPLQELDTAPQITGEPNVLAE